LSLIALGKFLINIIGFNFVWFGLVYWGNTFIPISLFILAAHLYFKAKGFGELKLIAAITVTGILVDSLLQYFTVFIFVDSSHIPFWLVMLWACFGATLCHSLRFLAGSKLLQLLVGGLLSPLSYIAGYKFKAVDFSLSLYTTYGILAAIWALLFVLFFFLQARLVKTEVNHV